jgi:hypothetical protein
MQAANYCCLISIKTGIGRQILAKVHVSDFMKIHSVVLELSQVDRQKDMAMLKGAFLQLSVVNMPHSNIHNWNQTPIIQLKPHCCFTVCTINMFSNWQLVDELLNINVDSKNWTTRVRFLRGNLQCRGAAFMLTVLAWLTL